MPLSMLPLSPSAVLAIRAIVIKVLSGSIHLDVPTLMFVAVEMITRTLSGFDGLRCVTILSVITASNYSSGYAHVTPYLCLSRP